MGLKSFSDSITTGPARTGTGKAGSLVPKKRGFTDLKKAALIKQGFSKTEVSTINKLKKSKPETGYRRITNPGKLPAGSNGTEAVKTFGFVDINRKTGELHAAIPRFTEERKPRTFQD
jgi:hypothetical protein